MIARSSTRRGTFHEIAGIPRNGHWLSAPIERDEQRFRGRQAFARLAVSNDIFECDRARSHLDEACFDANEVIIPCGRVIPNRRFCYGERGTAPLQLGV